MAISNVVRRWLPAVLLTIFVCECVWFMRTQSLTFDEPIHIAEGLDALRNHRFQDWNDHPPLARLWCALPLFANSGYRINALPLLGPEGKISDFAPDPQAIAVRARSMILVLGLILGLLIWQTARRMFSSAAANLALALFVFSPALVAHSSLATTDCIAALMILATAAALPWWRKRPTLARTGIFGVVLGLLLLAKFSTPPMFVLALGWMLVLQPEWLQFNPLRWNWGKMVVALLVASFVVWAGYFFHVSRLQIQDGMLTATFPNRTPFEHKVNFQHLKLSMPLPAGEYFQGLWRVAQDNKMGHAAFFLGHISKRGGFKLYYPVTVLLKWPLIVLLLFAVSCGLLLARKIRVPAGLWVMLSFPAVYFAMAIFAHFNIGDRHILPVYPFVLLVASGVWEAAVKRGWARKLIVVAVLLAAIDSLRSGPDYLAFFNIYVRPTEAYRLLTDSNLDWGQGLLALRDYESAHPNDDISVAYFGSVDPRAYGIKARLLSPGERARGTVIVSATNLSGQYLDDPQSYRWVLQYPQVGVVDGNMYVFKVP
jgi:hypothetical protein